MFLFLAGNGDVTAEDKCPKLDECPYNAQNCDEDLDCSSDSICCDSPCGKVCSKQLNTGL